MRTARRGWGPSPTIEMDLGLEGKVAWVLGASSGLGRATALSLAREGAVVAVSARRADVLAEAAAAIAKDTSGRCLPVAADVESAESIASAATRVEAELGPVDVLVSNGGGPRPGPFEDHDDDDLYEAFTVTTASAWRLVKAVVPSMRARGGGCLIFITSTSTKEVIENLLFSNMLRTAVVGMAKTLSKELGRGGIRTVCVAPGRIETPRLVELHEGVAARTGRSLEEVRTAGRAIISLGRFGRPEEVGDVIAFLASERASYISGITVTIDGGLLNGVLS
jgi:3-oxoacyl-[acyl-carrier protein] reductase